MATETSSKRTYLARPSGGSVKSRLSRKATDALVPYLWENFKWPTTKHSTPDGGTWRYCVETCGGFQLCRVVGTRTPQL